MATITKTVKGMEYLNIYGFRPCMITVRATKDKLGKSISFSDNGGALLIVPVEAITDILKEVLDD